MALLDHYQIVGFLPIRLAASDVPAQGNGFCKNR
jgi:hypothetical protein